MEKKVEDLKTQLTEVSFRLKLSLANRLLICCNWQLFTLILEALGSLSFIVSTRKFQKLKEIRTVQLEQKWALLTCLSPLKEMTCHYAPSCFGKVNRFNILKTEKKSCDDTDTIFKVEEIKIIGRKKKRNTRCPQEVSSLILRPIVHF